MRPEILTKKSRTAQRDDDKNLYHERHLVENSFEKLKYWCGVTMRSKRLSSLRYISVIWSYGFITPNDTVWTVELFKN